VAWLRDTAAALADLVLPVACLGCATPDAPAGVCPDCRATLAARPPAPVRPDPAPPGLPPCVAAGGYEDPLRALVLGYKEDGRHGLAAFLGTLLARAVAGAGDSGPGLLLVPVPATAAAVRRRHGDHMRRLARHAADALRRCGSPAAVAAPLHARPRPDFAGLSSTERAAAAAASFAPRPGPLAALRRAQAAGARVVLVDDVLTTGATLAAASAVLAGGGVHVPQAAVLAATRRHAR